jgi:hypothetical protein
VNLPAELPHRGARTALRRSLVFAAAFLLALLAPTVAVAVGTAGSGNAPIVEELFPAGVQTARGETAQAARTARVTAQRSTTTPFAAPSESAPRSVIRSSLSARHGPPPLRGPPRLAIS